MSKTPKHPPTCQPIEHKDYGPQAVEEMFEANKNKTNLIQLQINLTNNQHNQHLINQIESIALKIINSPEHGITNSLEHISIKKSIQQIIDLKVRK